MFIKKFFLLLFIICLFYSLVYSQSTEVTFEPITKGHTERLTIADGLLDNTIRKIAQDSLGFIWMGHVGLQKYDGITFTNYLHDPDDDRSIRNNYLYKIFTDSRKRLWVPVNGGIDQYIYTKDYFKHYYYTNQKGDTIPYNVFSLCEDTSRNLYAGLNFAEGDDILKYDDWPPNGMYTQRGVYRFDPQNESFIGLDWVNDLLNSFCKEGYMKKTEKEGIWKKTIIFPAEFFNGTLYYSFSIIRKNNTSEDEPLPDFNQSRKVKLNHNRIELPAVQFMEEINPSSVKYTGGKNPNRPVEVHFRFDANKLEKPLQEGDVVQIRGDFYPLCYAREPYLKFIAFDNNNRLWVALFPTLGLFTFDLEDKSWRHFVFNPLGNTLYSGSDWTHGSNMVNDVFVARNGHVWIATWGGLNRYIPERDTMISYYNNPGDKYDYRVQFNYVISLGEDAYGNIWMGNSGAVFVYQPDTDRFFIISENVSSYFKYGMLVDKSGIIWLGIDSYGIIKIITSSPRFESHDFPEIERTCSIYEDRNGITWIGGNWRGLLKYSRKTKEIITPGVIWKNDSLPLTGIADFCQDHNGLLWFCNLNGLYYHNPEINRIKLFTIDSSGFSETAKMLTALCEVNGVLWTASESGFLSRIDPVRMTYRTYESGGAIYDLSADRDGKLWLIGIKGLVKFDPEKEQFETVDGKSRGISLSIDRNGKIWYAGGGQTTYTLYNTSGSTDLGKDLHACNPLTNEITHITTRDGLLSASIMGLETDDSGHVWISSRKGLSRYNPATKAFRHYFKGTGLDNDEFLPWSHSKNSSGEIFFVTKKGFIVFHPDSLVKHNYIPDIVLTGLDVNNAPLETVEDKAINQSVNTLKDLELNYDQNDLSFSFAALDYTSPQRNTYTFMLENYDDSWRHETSENKAYYTNLDPGKYIFKVKGSNSYGVWNEKPTILNITIWPPWWQTQLAYIFYFVFLIVLIIGTWRLQLRRIYLRQQMQMEHFEAEKLREVDHLKSRFFANISHEFRTPLTLIKGPVKQMLDGKFIGNIKEQYRMILRNSDRLLSLINQILDLSKLESGEMKLKVAETEIVKFVKGMVLSFSSLAETKKVTLKFSSSENSMIGYFDRDKVEKIITNLLSNAFKFTPEGGFVEVAVENIPTPLSPPRRGISSYPSREGLGVGKGLSNLLKITVSNSGFGIPTEQLDKIFDRFYQTDDNYKKDGEGTGIGLALTKELVEVCRGEISVDSIPGESTTFKVKLPIDRESFKEDEVITPLSPPLARGDTWGVLGEKKSVRARHSSQESIKKPKMLDWNSSPIQPDDRPLRSAGKSAPLLLIVEDNPDVTNYISSFMVNDYRILTAENGQKGLKKTIDKYPDLVISDVMMPEMDGFELCNKIKSDPQTSHIPVILLTARADLPSKIEGLEFGADDYISKPFEASELQVRAKNLIDQRRKLREKFSRMIEINPAEISASSMDEKFLKRLLDVFENHISETDYSIESFASEIGMSRSNLHRKLKALTNQPTHVFLRILRLKRAAQLLKKSAGTISEIAYTVGFANPSYFSKMFQQYFGQSPGKFIQKIDKD